MKEFFLMLAITSMLSCTSNETQPLSVVDSSVALPSTIEKKIDFPTNMADAEFVAKLKEFGYFEHIQKGKLSLLEDSLKAHFNGDKRFTVETSSKFPYQSFNLRFYNCDDGETLYEEGGAVDLINEMQPFLNTIGVRMQHSNDNYFNNTHSIKINGTSYVLASGNSLLLTAETIQRFAEMINYELSKQNTAERIYILEDEVIYLVFLTNEQYHLISTYFDFDHRPLTVTDWVTRSEYEMKKLMNN